MNMKKILLGAAILASSIGAANATVLPTTPISGLYDTGAGVTTSGAADVHYALSSASTSSTQGHVATTSNFPFPYWLADSASSASHWITPTASQGQSFDPSANGTYTWDLKFDLTGFNASTAAFAGKFAADNSAIAYLNGTQIGTSNNLSNWSTFAATSNLFVAGVNDIQFVVTNFAQNGGNPTGLRVEFDTSSVSPVPEAEEWAMMLVGLGLIGVAAIIKK
jgi:hypothetical protein